MHRGNLSRRGFLQRSLSGLAAAGLPLWYAREVVAADEKQDGAKNPQPNDRIVIGLIGCGGQGRGITNGALNQKGVEISAVCDVDGKRAADFANELKTKRKAEVQTYKDFRELLDRKDINAVTIGTPDHWHTLVAIDALRKGKDVYCEKPLTLTVAEGQALTRVAKATGRIFQVGSQQRSDARFRLACELVRNGRIGKVKRVETRIGDNPKGGPFSTSPVPEGLDWDFWQGQTPAVDYVKERCHYQFRWWYEYSGGKMTDWGAHHNDIAQWGLGMDGNGPVAVEATGEAPDKRPNCYNCHPHFFVTYRYANGTILNCTDKASPQSPEAKEKGHDNGVLFEGEDGKWIFVSRGTIVASDGDAKTSKLLNEPLGPDATRLYVVSGGHMGNFINGIRTRTPCICTAEVGHSSVTVCHIGVIATRLGKKLKWDPVAHRFDDAEANALLSRPMRKPWSLDV